MRSPVHQLVLNALELEITDASLDGKALPKSAIKIDKRKGTAHARIAVRASRREITHSRSVSPGKINQQGQGLFYVRYQEQGSGAQKKFMLGNAIRSDRCSPIFPVLG